jgi:hypothetical protein
MPVSVGVVKSFRTLEAKQNLEIGRRKTQLYGNAQLVNKTFSKTADY